MHRVLKAFPCSFDGIHSEPLEPGDERDFGSMADGLVRAGLIGDSKPGGAAGEQAAGFEPLPEADPLDHDGDGRKGGSKPKAGKAKTAAS